MKNHRKILLTICILPLLAFIFGLVGSWGAIHWEFFLPITAVFVIIVFLITFIRLIISVIKRNKIKERFISAILAFLLCYIFTFQGKIAFYGAVVHYKLINSRNYTALRDWADTIEFEQNERYYSLHWQFDEFPDCIAKFNPMYVYVSEQNNDKVTYLTWSSGLMAYELRLSIAPANMEQSEIVFPERTFFIAKIRDGVFLSRSTN